MANIETFGGEREDIQPSKFKRYKGKAGQTDRVGILYDGEPTKLFKGTMVHFKDRFFLCKSTKQKKEICCLQSYEGNRPKYRIGGIIIVYNLVNDGGKTKLKDYELLPWVFGEKMYQKMHEIDKEYKLAEHDIKLTCTNEDYQELNPVNCKESIWSQNPELKTKILKEAAPMFEELANNLAADLSITEIRELLGIDAPGSVDAASDVDLDQVIDTIAK